MEIDLAQLGNSAAGSYLLRAEIISYGGSSLISLAYGMGMLVALTRERPRAKLGGEVMFAASPA